MPAKLIDCEGELINETDAAWLFKYEGEEVWLPKSQCEWDEGAGVMKIPEWLLIKQGLI